mgnify:CR=1 FL=1
MFQVQPLSAEILTSFPKVDAEKVDLQLAQQLKNLNRKIVVLDDDPTGVQTVHHIPVYTSWDEETMLQAFREEGSMFFILTNSRGMTHRETVEQHKIMAQNVVKASRETGKDYILISRSDSTLRGHYPWEPLTLKEEIESLSDKRFDGEIIYPFFQEGGRYTIGGVHYVQEGDQLIPAGQTEFAKDKSFGYKASYLPDWCEEKSQGRYRAQDVVRIAMEDLRSGNVEKICSQLLSLKDFNKVVVDSVNYVDTKVFAIAFCMAVAQGKEFLFRSAAAITKVLGGVPDQPLLARKDLVVAGSTNGGIVLVGSHVNKTTAQLQELHNCKYPITFLEFNQHRVLEEGGLEDEVQKMVSRVQEEILQGRTVAVYTRRERFDLDTDDKEKQLQVSVQISDAVTSIIGRLTVQPSFIIAKGGITSSDVGVKALRVHRAMVMGQVRPGIPAWRTGPESKFPNMPYIIFPGNVGTVEDLRIIVENLMEE